MIGAGEDTYDAATYVMPITQPTGSRVDRSSVNKVRYVESIMRITVKRLAKMNTKERKKKGTKQSRLSKSWAWEKGKKRTETQTAAAAEARDSDDDDDHEFVLVDSSSDEECGFHVSQDREQLNAV